MTHRGIVTIAAIIAVVAVGGIGFAAFTSSAYINASGTAGTFGPLYWTAASGTAAVGSSADLSCGAKISTTVNTSDTLTLTAGSMVPGDQCSFSATLNNGGNLPGSVTEVYGTPSGACSDFVFSDNAWSSTSIGASPATLSYSATVTLNSGGNGLQGVTCSWGVTVSGAAA
jgi:hypothetical protein